MKPLSPMDAMFLWMEHRRQPMHVAGLQLYTPPPDAGPDFIQELVEAFRQHTEAQPPFNLRPVFKLGHWFWEEDEEFELDYHLRHSALPRPGRIRELLALVSRLHGSLMDRSRPLWELNIIEGLADGRVAVYVKVHHAMFDGVAATRMLQSSLSEDPQERKPPVWAQSPRRRGTKAEVAPVARKLLQPLFDAVRLGNDIAPGIGSGLWEIVRSSQSYPADAQPFHAPATFFNVKFSGSRRFAAQSYSIERLKKLGKRNGATLNDVSLAICAGALRKYLLAHDALPDKPLIAMVPVSTRAEGQEGGNQVSMILANLATHVDDPAQRLRLIMQSTSQGKDRIGRMSKLQQMAHAAAMATPLGATMLTGQAGRRPIFNVVISNVPGPKKPLYMNGFHLDETYPISIPFDYAALNITLNGCCDHLGFGYTACRRSVPALQRMLDYTDEALRELEGA
ncbi:MAG: wax ester/triacylglycerol synthase family O-acyltransferase [Nevskia sp.]|nr:wax ester/triacylglycerol synthase family O-acyltransferase [Nevskia sp.]